MDILVLDDGVKGNFNQAYGIASALSGAKIEILSIPTRGILYFLPGRKGRYPLSGKLLAFLCTLGMRGLTSAFTDTILPEWKRLRGRQFRLVISSGSVLAPFNIALSRKFGAKSVNVMVPSLIKLKLFDYLIIPYHDYMRLPVKRRPDNLIVTMGAPNRITSDFLEAEKKRLMKTINIDETKKTIGVIIGGNDQNYRISTKFIHALISALSISAGRHNFIFTTSRRTPETVVAFLQEHLKDIKNVVYAEFPGYSSQSQYPGILALCDYILVTEDSINMVSEAAGTGMPVLILGVERKKPGRKLIFDLTLEKFTEKRYAEYLPADEIYRINEKLELTEKVSCERLNEARECAQKILKTLG